MTKLPEPFDAQGQHFINIRVYYEDTDFTGMVYHANYLRFFERGRSDFLRDAGVSHQNLLSRETPAAFTLTNVEVDYKSAANVDDLLTIRTRSMGVKGVRMYFDQTCLRGTDLIAEARITAVMIHADGRPMRPLKDVVEQLKPFQYAEA
ncbi:MAG: YbgC/FadM family acyl-CoA thioesterase [Henriciella sp.]|nr:YbgC/FadM family acyl-CoA thioesterase [Henriciella sp.]